MTQIVLASTSPRRRQLLEQIKLDFVVVAPDYEEVIDTTVDPLDLVQTLALGKALSVASFRPDDIVIGADTLVLFDGDVIGKPTSAATAVETLQRLRNNVNTVITGWAVVKGDTQFVGVSSSQVWINDITDANVEAYVATKEPLDKAGSYAVTGIGSIFINHIEGSIDSTVGLPLCPVAKALKKLGVDVLEPR